MFADVSGDGRADLYITMIFKAPMPDLFYRNLGHGHFVEEGKGRGIADFDGGSHGACFADLDNDGDYDLFSVTNYRGSADPADERNEAYRNEGSFRFTPIVSSDLLTAPCGQGATDADFDGDGDIDVIAANRSGDVNILRNNGKGQFKLVAPASLGIRHRATDGITMGDVDTDGDLDMLLAGNNVGHLYLNRGDGTFAHRQSFSGTDGYMGGFADLDNDGDLDFAVACKRSGNQLIRNDQADGNWLKIRLISAQGQAGAFGAKIHIYQVNPTGKSLLGVRETRSSNGYLGQNDPVLHFGLGAHERVEVLVKFLDGTSMKRAGVAANQTITIDGRKR